MKKKSHTISDEERQLFRNAVSHVKPTHPVEEKEIITKEVNTLEKISAKRRVIKPIDALPLKKATFQFTSKQPDITGDSIISFAHMGLQNKRFAQLKQGKMRAEATLDLHEHTVDEAIRATDNFLMRCQKNHFRTVCIIHGKGLFSTGNKPVLKNFLNLYLREHPCVLAFHSAKNNQGGTGAIMVMLKSM